MNHVSSEILAALLDELEADEAAVEDYAIREPDVADDLRSMIDVVQSISPPPPVSVDPMTHARLRSQLLAEMAIVRSPRRDPWARWFTQLIFNAFGQAARALSYVEPKPLLVGALVIALTSSFGGGAVFAAEGTIPGDTLYPVKITLESIELAVAPNDAARGELLIELANVRLVEVEKAAQAGRIESVRAATSSYAQEVAEASQALALASAAGTDVSGIGARLESTDASRRASAASEPMTRPDGSTADFNAPPDPNRNATSTVGAELALGDPASAVPSLSTEGSTTTIEGSGSPKAPTAVPPILQSSPSTTASSLSASAQTSQTGRPGGGLSLTLSGTVGSPGPTTATAVPSTLPDKPGLRDRIVDRREHLGEPGWFPHANDVGSAPHGQVTPVKPTPKVIAIRPHTTLPVATAVRPSSPSVASGKKSIPSPTRASGPAPIPSRPSRLTVNPQSSAGDAVVTSRPHQVAIHGG